MEVSSMEELDKNLKELTLGLVWASLVLGLLALIMIRFGYTRPGNEIWNCIVISLKGCFCGWFFIAGRYSGKQVLQAKVELFEQKLMNAQEKLRDQKLNWDEKVTKSRQKIEVLKRDVENSKNREEALAQQIKAFKRTPGDANQTALKSFL